MRDSLKQILQAEGMDETLEEVLLEKLKYRENLIKRLKECAQKISSNRTDLFSQSSLKAKFDLLVLKDELNFLDKTINSIAYYLTRLALVQTAEKNCGSGWNQIMARLDNLDIVDVVSHYVEVANPHRLIRCPIHEDRTPSFKIYQNTNSFYCFGCMRGGAPINFIMLVEGVSFKEALKYL